MQGRIQFMIRAMGIFSLFVFLLIWTTGIGWAQDFRGNKCWKVHVTERQGVPANEWFMMRMHIVPLDATTYVIHGTVDTPGDLTFISTGTGAHRGAKIYLNLVFTHPHLNGWRDTQITRVELNPTTLKGPIWGFLKSYNISSHEFDQDEYILGSMVPAACQ